MREDEGWQMKEGENDHTECTMCGLSTMLSKADIHL